MVTETDKRYKDILGYRLIFINGIDINSVINDVVTLIACDYSNEQKGLGHVKDIINSYEVLSFSNVVDTNKAEYILKIIIMKK